MIVRLVKSEDGKREHYECKGQEGGGIVIPIVFLVGLVVMLWSVF